MSGTCKLNKNIFKFFSLPMLLNGLNGEGETVEFSVSLCGDVFLEIICLGNRQNTVKLERVGRRIHWMVEKFSEERPFLRIGIEIDPWFFLLFQWAVFIGDGIPRRGGKCRTSRNLRFIENSRTSEVAEKPSPIAPFS